MSEIYARVRNGAITPIRFTRRQLKFNNTLYIVLATGDDIIPLLQPADNLTPESQPSYRPPLQEELDNKILTESDMDTVLFHYDVGVSVAGLDESGDIPMENIIDSVKTYEGLWDPVSNTPELIDGVGNSGQIYQVAEGYGEDVEFDLGSGPQKCRSGGRIEYRDGAWKSVGYLLLDDYEQSLFDKSMHRMAHNEYDGEWGSDQGAFDIVTYPAILETLNKGVMVGQLKGVNCVRDELHLIDNDGLDDLFFNPITGEIFLDAKTTPVGTYYPTFIVSSSLNRSNPIPIRIDVMEYYLETDNDVIIIESGEVHSEPITSPQDETPALKIVDVGETWDARVSDDGTKVEIDTFCCAPGPYEVQVVSSGTKGTSEILTIQSEVVVGEGKEVPIWEKQTIPTGGLSPIHEDNLAMVRMDITPIDALPLDY